MINLLKLVNDGVITTTGEQVNLPIEMPNVEKRQPIYNIPLKYLYYNDSNGRVSTSISHNNHIPTPTADIVNPEYNKLFENIISSDNATKIAQTKRSIKERGQQVFGYVLNDGRVIDGNRRFTALRQLQREDGKTRYFKAIILPFSYNSLGDRQMVKRLELMLQMGEESKIDYDPVSLAVDIYRTVNDERLMTINDYANYAGMSPKSVGDNITVVQWMRDFLDFIGADKDDYSIIKDANIYNQLLEIAKGVGKAYTPGSVDYEQTKASAFAVMINLMNLGGDRVRDIRVYLNNIVRTPQNNNFNDQIEDTVDDMRDKLVNSNITSSRELSVALQSIGDELRTVNKSYSQIVTDNNRGKNVDNLIGDVAKCRQTLSSIIHNDGLAGSLTWRDLSPSQIDNLRSYAREINALSNNLFNIYDEHSR